MTEADRPTGPQPSERPSSWQIFAQKLVGRGDAAEIIRTVDASRREPGTHWATGPDQAVAMLECLAAQADPAVLVEAVGTLSGDVRGDDTELLMDTAAATRPARQAAALLMMLAEARHPGEAERLAGEFAAHRTPRDLARFALSLYLAGDPHRVEQFLQAVTDRRGVRDLARLCLAVRASGLEDHAGELLAAILGTKRADADLDSLVSVVGPRVLDDWISTAPADAARRAEQSPGSERQQVADDRAEQAARLSAALLRHGHRPSPAVIRSIATDLPVRHIRDLLAEPRDTGLRHDEAELLIDAFADLSQAGRTRSYDQMLELLGMLNRGLPEEYARLRDRLAHRRDIYGLVSLIIAWSDADGTLAERLPQFLRVVTQGSLEPGIPGGPPPRSLTDLQAITDGLNQYGRRGRACVEQLAVEAVRSVRCRGVGEAARLLVLFPERRGRSTRAYILAEGLIERLKTGDIGPAELADYVRELHELKLTSAVDALRDEAVRGLTDPRMSARLAVALWKAGYEDECEDLLRRWLERDRLVAPASVAAVLLEVRVIPGDRRLRILEESVGRWPQNRRELAAAQLRGHPELRAEADVLSA